MADPKKKPSKPSNLSIDRINHKDEFKVKWKKAVAKGDARVQTQNVKWYYKTHEDVYADSKATTKSQKTSWRAAKKGTGSPALSIHEHIHEFGSVDSSETNIRKVRAAVWFSNSKGSSSKAYVEMTLNPADAPVVTTEASGGVPKVSITFQGDTDTQPLYKGDVKEAASWYISKQTKDGSTISQNSTVESRAKGASTAANRSMSAISGGTLSPSLPTKYTISATIDGAVKYLSGKSWVSDKTTTKTMYVAKPNIPTIYDVTAEGHSYTVSWTYNTNGGWQPADSYELFYSDVDQDKDEESASSWTSIEDKLTATSYTSTIAGAIPDGMKRCFMVKAEHYGIESDYAPYCPAIMWGAPEPPEITVLGNTITVKAPTKCCPDTIVRLYREQAGKSAPLSEFSIRDKTTLVYTDTKAASGEPLRYYANATNTNYGGRFSINAYSSAVVTPNETHFKTWTKTDDCETVNLSWDRPTGNVTGYEVAWGESDDAFTSNKQPSTLTIDGESTTSCRISGLQPGSHYWFWIRTIGTADGTEYKSGWQNDGANVMMANKPDKPGVTLSSDFVIVGKDELTIGWSYSALGDAPQTSWDVIIQGAGITTPIKHSSSEKGRTAADGAITIDTSKLPKGGKTCTVTVSNVNGSNSTTVPFEVAVIPKASMTMASSITAQPVSVTVSADSGNPSNTEYVVEFENRRGVVQQLPNGERVQYDGENIGSYLVGNGASSVKPPLIDGGKYRARVTSTDPDTNLRSESDWTEFEVAWARQAEAPELKVVPDGDTATISSPDWDGIDDLSIWRATKDGVTLAVGSATLGSSYIDPLAPFGGAWYRASVETADGDVSFTDWGVDIQTQDVRIDFGENSATLTYNIANGDTRESGDEVKRFLDGSKAAITKRGTSRTQNLSAVLVRGIDDDALTRIYALSRFDGICFVRTPDGMAYPAAVTVGIDQDAKSKLVEVSITCNEVDDDGLFLAKEVESDGLV